MMDIAAIRKKAHNSKTIDAEKLTFTLPPTPPVGDVPAAQGGAAHSTGVPSEPVRAMETFAPKPESAHLEGETPQVMAAPLPADVLREPQGRDGLEALFNWSPEQDVAQADEQGVSLPALAGTAEDEYSRWLAFSLGEEEYALDIKFIREIIKPREITDIPRVPGFLLGIISLRGNIIPVFDLKNRLRLGVSEILPSSRIVVCQHGERFAGLLVDCISHVASLQEQQIEPPPSVLSGIDRELVEGIGRQSGRMMILLHLRSVLDVDLS